MQRQQCRVHQQGFTLLEVLISFSLVSLLFLALFSSFTTMSRGWDAAEKRIEKTEDMRLITGFLRRQLNQMMVVKIQGDDGPQYAFEGDDFYIRFAAPMQPFNDRGGVYLIELTVERGKNGKSLELRYSPYRPELSWDDAFDEVEPVLVYDGLDHAEFEFLVAESIDDDPYWENEWVDQPFYPLLLKLSMEDKKGGVWPEMIVELPQVDEYVDMAAR